MPPLQRARHGLAPTKCATLGYNPSVPAYAQAVIANLESQAARLRARGVLRLGLFGSVARGEEHAGSDIDLVIEVADSDPDAYFDTWDELEDLLGRKVDLVPFGAIRPEMRGFVEPEVIYAKGF